MGYHLQRSMLEKAMGIENISIFDKDGADMTRMSRACPCLELSISRTAP